MSSIASPITSGVCSMSPALPAKNFSAALVAAGLSDDTIDVERTSKRRSGRGSNPRSFGGFRVARWNIFGLYAFRHILYQNIIYQNLPPGHRAQTHKRMGKRHGGAYTGRTPEIAPALTFTLSRDATFESALLPPGSGKELDETSRPPPRRPQVISPARLACRSHVSMLPTNSQPRRSSAAAKLGSSLVRRPRRLHP